MTGACTQGAPNCFFCSVAPCEQSYGIHWRCPARCALGPPSGQVVMRQALGAVTLFGIVACGGRTALDGSELETDSPNGGGATTSSTSVAGVSASSNSGVAETHASTAATSTSSATATIVGPPDGGQDGSWGTGECSSSPSGDVCSPALPTFIQPSQPDAVRQAPTGAIGSWVGCQYEACVPNGGCVACVCESGESGPAWVCYETSP